LARERVHVPRPMALSIAASPYLGTARSLAKTEGRSRVGCVRDPAHPSRLIACRHRIETARVEKSPNPRALTPRSSTSFRIFRRRSGRSAGIVRASAEDSRIIRVESKLECVSRREPRAIGARATRRAAFPGTAIGSVGVARASQNHPTSYREPAPRPLPPRSDAPGLPPAPRARD